MKASGLLAVALATGRDYLSVSLGSWRRRHRPTQRIAHQDRIMRRWGASLCRAFGLELTVQGNLPEPPFFLVTNHLSYVDIPLLGSLVGGTFVAKADLGAWPVVGSICRASDTLLIDRGTKRDLLRIGALAEERLNHGGGIILFGEGTTGDGSELLPFKASLLEVAVRAGYPVHYATLAYRTPPGAQRARDAICWYGDEELAPHFKRFQRLRGFEATVTFGDQPLVGEDRKQLAAALRQAMARQFVVTD
ncbi:MAG: lysophospholipid acyltransferase family protein [Acidobacteriota bacterium]